MARIAQSFGISRRTKRMSDAASETHLLRESENIRVELKGAFLIIHQDAVKPNSHFDLSIRQRLTPMRSSSAWYRGSARNGARSG